MIWKLDVLISKESMVEPVEPLKDETFTEKKSMKRIILFSDEPEETNRQTNNDSNKTKRKQVEDETQENTSEKQVKPSKEELGFASILEVEEFDDPEKIKNSYRKIIAQYHPDRVRALGPEISDVAEKKAKEINEAYEYFRKNSNLSEKKFMVSLAI